MGAVVYIGTGWPQWKPLGISGTHLPIKRGSWLTFINVLANQRYTLCKCWLEVLCQILFFFFFFISGRFDISHRKYQFLGCLKVLSTSDPVVLLQSKFWPGSISDMTYVFDQDLLLQWDILQKQIPGISERAFLKSLELYSKRKGRVSETNLSSCTPSHIICSYNKQYTSQIADRWRRFSWWICWLRDTSQPKFDLK